MIRSFIACDIPQSIRDNISEVMKGLSSVSAKVSWIRPDNMHITLKFLGPVQEDKLEGISGLLDTMSSGYSPFDISIRGAGAYPSLSDPRVFWFGILDGSGTMRMLRDVIEKGLEGLGFEPDKRRFSPHLTIGRSRGTDNRVLSACMSRLGALDCGSFKIDKVNLYKSELAPGGAIYQVLHTSRLRG